MRLFGEYLIEKGLVTEDMLAEALVAQIKSSPTVAEVVFQRQLLSPAVQLKVFQVQMLQAAEYRQACKALGYWNERIEAEVYESVMKNRKPVGQLLAEKGYLSYRDLTDALEEFVVLKKGSKDSSVSQSEKTFEFKRIPAALVYEFLRCYPEEKRRQWENIVAFGLDRSGEDREFSIAGLLPGIGAVRDAAEFIDAKLLPTLFDACYEGLRGIDSAKTPVNESNAVFELVKRSNAEAWKLRQSIVDRLTEESYWQDSTRRRIFSKLISDWSQIVEVPDRWSGSCLFSCESAG